MTGYAANPAGTSFLPRLSTKAPCNITMTAKGDVRATYRNHKATDKRKLCRRYSCVSFQVAADQWPTLERHIGNTYEYSNAIRELQRISIYRAFADERGLLRPFLLLASMHPTRRKMWGSYLNISIDTKHFHGDAHAEAWCILTNERAGVVHLISKRSKSSEETSLKEVEEGITWEAIMGIILPQDTEDLPFETGKTNVKKPSRMNRWTATSTLQMEEEILKILTTMTREFVGERVLHELDAVRSSNPTMTDVLLERLMNEGHFDDETILQTYVSGIMLPKAQKTKLVKALRAFCPKRSHSRLREVAKLFVGAMHLDAAPFDASPWQLFNNCAFRTIVNNKPVLLPIVGACVMQRAFLACGGVDIEQYCY
eukprot:CFRG2753T1